MKIHFTRKKSGIFLLTLIKFPIFLILIILHITYQIIIWLLTRKFLPSFFKVTIKSDIDLVFTKIISIIDPERYQSFNRSYLIELSLNNMKAKRTRTLVTIGGMAISIALIVFLVSVGYGLQNLVVTRVAGLDELKQADVLPGLSEDLVLNDETIVKFSSIPNVTQTMPIISSVGRISYKESVSDIAVYAVTTDYLKNSTLKPIRGKIFENAGSTVLNPEIKPLSTTKTEKNNETKVLGTSTGSLPLVNISEESPVLKDVEKKVIDISVNAKREAILNRAVLQILNMSEDKAVGKKVNISFVIVDNLLLDDLKRVESRETEYTIVGVNPDDDTPMIYVPFIDLKTMGISKYSQIKLVVSKPENLSKVRSTIEASGYGTVSVADTVAQIDNLFSSFRVLLSIVGMVALSVAALGMFNTLTVSLLERTREVGLMKAMGMKTSEVEELFLTESVIIGFFGGIIGLIVGTILGKILGLTLTSISLIKGVGTIDISFVSPELVLVVLVLSIIVGILTGYFPAKRATKISALNALRYE